MVDRAIAYSASASRDCVQVQLRGPNTTEGCTAYVDYSALLGHLGEEV